MSEEMTEAMENLRKEMKKCPICNEKRPCFAKAKYGGKKCTILSETYPEGKCPFRKERL